ncbi:unnamed protein product [Calypogeia fissa]
MEDGKSSSIAEATTDDIVMKVSSQGTGESCQSSPSRALKGNGNGLSSVAQQPQQPQQQQEQQLPGALRRHTAMAAQQQHAALGGQSESPHGGGWGSTPTWEHARSIAESMEGGTPPEYNGGRSVEWDVKGSSWDWEHVSGAVFPGRRGDASMTVSFASSGQSSESVSVGVAVASSGNRVGALPAKNESDQRDSAAPETRRVGNVAAGVEQRFSTSCSVFSSEQQRRLGLGLGETGERRKSNVQEYSNGGGRVNVGGTDSLIGLKLGRRTYFEDSGGGGRGAGPAVFAVCPPGKKQRVQSPGIQVPRCQVEGCKQDLSASKDYHRRHKVCELHSKAAKVMAAGFEQRFCQQCSRFHVLTEFDEGKRSCRRRLAGHNERRRKPQPESAAIVSTGCSTVFQNEGGSHASSVNGEESKRGTNGLTEQACFIPMQRTPGSSSTSIDSDDQSGSLGGNNFKLTQGKGPWPGLGRVDDSTGLACQSQVGCRERQPFLSSTTDRVLMFLQSPKRQIGGAGVHHYATEGSGSAGPGLTLSSSSGPASVLAGLDAPTSPSVSGISDSGRALSLLSSQAWGSRGGASGSVSLAVSTQSDVTLEQLISENTRTPFSPRGPQSHYHASTPGTVEKLFRHQPHSPRDIVVSPVNQGESREQHQSLLSGLGMVGSFESHSMLAVMQGQSEFRGLQGSSSSQRPTIDLMQLPSPQSHGQFAEFSALRPFESSLFDSQQML